MIDGKGDPNTEPEFSEKIQVLYGLAYTMKFMLKQGSPAVDFVVPPLSGLWCADDISAFHAGPKNEWLWTLFKAAGRFATGKPFSLYHDSEYKEESADIEACLEVKKEIRKAGISCHLLAGGKALTLIHYGPYEELGRSYQRLYEGCREKNLAVVLPIREQYLKGPGLIFRGNPRKYVTKLVFNIQS